MHPAVRTAVLGLVAWSFASTPARGADPGAKVEAVFKTHCHRCHGADGTNEGGVNYVADLGNGTVRRIAGALPERAAAPDGGAP